MRCTVQDTKETASAYIQALLICNLISSTTVLQVQRAATPSHRRRDPKLAGQKPITSKILPSSFGSARLSYLV
jgi:hypothetical protein